MIFFDREKQCKNCYHECGWDEAVEKCEDGTILYEHFFECKLGNQCETDLHCGEFTEDN